MGEREVAAALELFWKRSEKKCKESRGKGILIIESRGSNPGFKISVVKMWRKLTVETSKERTCVI